MPDSHDSLALSMAVSTADLSAVCGWQKPMVGRCGLKSGGNVCAGLILGRGGLAAPKQTRRKERFPVEVDGSMGCSAEAAFYKQSCGGADPRMAMTLPNPDPRQQRPERRIG